VQAVASKAERIAAALGQGSSSLVAAAWLHDIGYSPVVRTTGFHPLDAATYLTTAGTPRPLAALVANHSAATVEAQSRGLSQELASFADDKGIVRDALWACDMTTGPTGQHLSLDERLGEIHIRYGPDHVVTRSITAAEPEIRAAVERTRALLHARGHQWIL
jgi:hypothetical protein